MTLFAHDPEVLAAVAEPDAPHSWKAAAAAEKHDLTLMQPLLPEPAFLSGTPWLLQCWTFIVQQSENFKREMQPLHGSAASACGVLRDSLN